MGTRIDLLVTAVTMPGSTKRQAEALAQAHTRIHKLVAVVKAKAMHDVATRTAVASTTTIQWLQHDVFASRSVSGDSDSV
jgi:hypothetical protein